MKNSGGRHCVDAVLGDLVRGALPDSVGTAPDQWDVSEHLWEEPIVPFIQHCGSHREATLLTLILKEAVSSQLVLERPTDGFGE